MSGVGRLVGVTVAVLAVGPLMVGCSAGGDGSATPDLAGRTFLSTAVRGHELVPDSTVSIAFDEGTISVNAGCNTLFGEASWDGGVLAAGQLASTRKACAEDLMAQDEWLAGFLASSPALTLDGATLTLGNDTTGITLQEE